MFALDFRFVLPFVLLVAAVALIEERIEVEFTRLDWMYDNVVNATACTRGAYSRLIAYLPFLSFRVLLPVYLRPPKIAMTSFFPTDAIRSRLEWNATLNPAAAPQTTEATKFLRKVIKPRHCRSDVCLLISSLQTSIIATIGEPRRFVM
jgi:hypothetical protein